MKKKNTAPRELKTKTNLSESVYTHNEHNLNISTCRRSIQNVVEVLYYNYFNISIRVCVCVCALNL